jgi:hypothetical protein
MVSVNVAPPTVVFGGDSELMDGAGLLIGKVQVPEVPPPGLGLETVTLAEPALVMSLAGTEAVIRAALT